MNRHYTELIYSRLKDSGFIKTRVISQAYDPEKEMFLADRFIVGTCPKCKTEGQYGDNCEACGATYDATDLINPVSKLSGATPVLKESTHYFFALSNFTDFLTKWTRSGTLQVQVTNKLSEWLDAGLQRSFLCVCLYTACHRGCSRPKCRRTWQKAVQIA